MVLLTLMGLAVAPAASLGQDTPEDDDPTLPEIAPREIEIRGEFQVGFPSLQRQPLRGFASPPSVPVLPPDRLPYTEDYKQQRSELPEKLPDPPSVRTRMAATDPPANGYVEAGAGRYLSRFAEGRVTLPVSSTESFEIDASYDGAAGYEPFDGSDASTSHDDLDGQLRFISQRDAASVNAGLRGLTSTYDLYGAQRAPGATAARETPSRTLQSAGLFARVRTHGRVPASFGFTFDQMSAGTTTGTGLPDREQQRFTLDAGGTLPFGSQEIRAGARFTTSGIGQGAFAGDVQTFDGGGSAVAYRSGPTVIRAGARLLTFSSAIDPTGTGTGEATATYISPTAELTVALTPRFTIFAVNEPGLEHNTLLSLHRSTPWLTPDVPVRPTLYTTRGRAGVRVSTGPLRFTSHAGLRYAPSYAVTDPTGLPDYDSGFFAVSYESARIAEAGASVALQGVDRVQAVLRATIRDGQLTDDDVAIPYFSPLLVESAVTYRFLDGDAQATMQLGIESPRYVDRAENEQTGTIADLDLAGSYRVTPSLDVVARLENVGASFERYPGYERPPTTISAGVRIHW